MKSSVVLGTGCDPEYSTRPKRWLIHFIISIIFVLSLFSCAKTVPVSSVKPGKTAPAKPARTATAKPVKKSKPVKKPAVVSKAVTTYQSAGNDVANIQLRLRDNNTFDFKMTILPKAPGEKEDVVTLEGVWKKEADRTVLQFNKKGVDLNALFDKSYDSGKEFEVLDPQRVALSDASAVIHIWGVVCEKK